MNDEILNLKEHLLYLDKTDDKHYIDKIIELYKDGIDEQTLQSIFWQRFEIEDWLTNKSLDGKDYTVLFKENEKGLFRSTTYKTDDVKQVWLRTIIYEDEDITINKPSSFGEAQLIGLNTWCFCKKESYWYQHHLPYSQDGNNETIYFIHNVMATYPKNYATDMVKENGKHEILDSLHHHIFPKEFFQQIGMDAANMLKPIITESKTHKNMNKKVIKINESQLREMIAESVKNVLKEELGVAPKMNFGQTASIKAKNLLYDYKELLNIVQGMAETSSDCEDVLGKIKAGYDGLYSLANWGK